MVRRSLGCSLRLLVGGVVLGGALLAACGGGQASGPAWPTSAEPETDGGESLSPRQASSVAAVEEAKDASPHTPAVVVPAAASVLAPAPVAKPAVPASDPAAPKEPEVLTTEEIIIEIDD